MEYDLERASKRAACYLQNLGVRPSTKGYQYLLFALTQLLENTPFRNTIWALTAIYFGQKRKNVLACVRRELFRAYEQESSGFYYEGDFICPSDPDEFLRFALASMNQQL